MIRVGVGRNWVEYYQFWACCCRKAILGRKGQSASAPSNRTRITDIRYQLCGDMLCLTYWTHWAFSKLQESSCQTVRQIMSEIDNVIYVSYFRLSILFENLCPTTLPYEATASAQRRGEKLMSSQRNHHRGINAPLTVKKESHQTATCCIRLPLNVRSNHLSQILISFQDNSRCMKKERAFVDILAWHEPYLFYFIRIVVCRRALFSLSVGCE